jgi:hypothetical protein
MWLAAVAALLCGLCWEMWNSRSMVHWEYAIPSVHGFKLFEMPLLGYAGYLPFGLECLAVVTLVFPQWTPFRPRESHHRPIERAGATVGEHSVREAGYFRV